MRIRTVLISAIAAISLAACGGGKKSADTTPAGGGKSLYDRLGGQDAIKAVVKDFVEENVAKDTRINARFANTDIPHLEQMLTEQICMASGGPCKYSGKDMKTAHTGMKITDDEFNALVEDLKKSLDKFKVGDKEQQDLLGALGPMKPDIVGQ
ncbi:MAG: group 1 truncated hemoglobin [Deltaproteobacteria bacterium]|nr:group 1 truncated hemoglobin [Deltaproteobacteria bacterium]